MTKKISPKVRLDKMLFDKGLVESREKSKAIVLEGSVYVNGFIVDKAGAMVTMDDDLRVENKMPFVSRGGYKIAHAIEHFGTEIKNKVVMDAGASTGGFTDYLLQKGALKVYAIDVGYGQFAWKLRNDPRVILHEKTNVRYLTHDAVPEPLDMVVIDVSFISLLKVLPKIMEFLKPSGEIIALIKPQFEAGRKDVGKGGVVKDESKRLEVIEKIKTGSENIGLDVIGTTESPIKGPKGNVEYLIYLKKR